MSGTKREARDLAPTSRQVHAAESITGWYLKLHYCSPSDQGVAQTFCDPARVGSFAVDLESIVRRDGGALFRLLVAVSMFQRRQDNQITRVLRSISPVDAEELTSAARLLHLSDASPCPHIKSTEALRFSCDLAKHPRTKLGICKANPKVECHMKRHTVLLRRYGHFGKVPTSAALVIREAGALDVAGLMERAVEAARGPEARARAIVDALSKAWRVSEKISSMFLSIVWNPDLTPGVTARRDVDWRHFVVIDSNVDAFLSAVEYEGAGTYEARRHFLRLLSKRVDLKVFRRGLRRDNPRLVQQALYLFMSATNRRAIAGDCMHLGPQACATCPRPLSRLCPVRASSSDSKKRLPVIA